MVAVFCLYTGLNFSYAQLGSWTQKTDFPGISRSGAVGFSIGSKGYIGTGYDGSSFPGTDMKDFWEYDPGTNTWSQKADFGGTERNDAVGFSIGSKGYIGTGYITSLSSPTKDFWEYDPNANTWIRKADFNGTERCSAVGFSIGTKGYIGTGASTTNYLKDFWAYDQNTNTWTRKADFGGTERYYAAGFAVGSKGYIGTGGMSYNGTNDFWEYDPGADSWVRKSDFEGTARVRAVGISIGSQGYIGTGFDGAFADTKDFWAYDPIANSWDQKTDFGGSERDEPVGFSIGTKGYIGTGMNSSTFNYYKDFWEYTPSSQTLDVVINPDSEFSLLAGLPYLYSIKVKSGSNSVPNSTINITDYVQEPSQGVTTQLTTNANGEGLYSNFVPYTVLDNTTYNINFTITAAGYPSQTITRRIKAMKPANMGNDEGDAMGICPTKIITGNGRQIMNYSKEGKLVAWYTPSVGSWNVIPYSTSTDKVNNSFMPLYGAPEHEGIFAGIEIDGMFRWLWQLPLPKIVHPDSNDPSVQITYTVPFDNGNIEIVLNSYSGNANDDPDVNLQSFTINNNTSISREIKLVYYGFVHPTNKNQDPKIEALMPFTAGWDFHNPENTKAYIVDGNKIFIEPDGEEYQHICIVGTENNATSMSGVEKCVFSLLDPNTNNFGVYNSDNINFQNQNYTATGNKTNWAVQYDLGIASPNNQKVFNIYSASGTDYFTTLDKMNHAIQYGYIPFENNSISWWVNQPFLSKIESLTSLNSDEINLLKRWVITCRMLVDNESGAIIASPNRQPKYYPVWVRDAVFQAMLWELLDQQDIVDKLIGFLVTISEQPLLNGSLRYWRQCYSIKPQPDNPNNRYMGLPYFYNGIDPSNLGMIEEDQMCEFLWFLYEVAKHRNYANPELAIPSTIDNAQITEIADLVKNQISTDNVDGKKPGLLQPSFDWYEFPENDGTRDDAINAFKDQNRAGIGQSIVTNSAAVKALEYCYILTGDQSYQQSSGVINNSININYINGDNSPSPPSYVQLINFIPGDPTVPLVYSTVPSTRKKSQLNNYASVWPFKLFNEQEPFFNNFRSEVDSYLTSSLDPSQKCFVPPYLMFALYELYHDPQPSFSKLDPIVDWLSDVTVDVKYIPEVFYKQGNEYKSKGTIPLGWSNAWGALALLAKANVRYQDLLINGKYENTVIKDSFDYPTLSEDTLWTMNIIQGCAPNPGTISLIDSTVRFYQSGAGQCDNSSFLLTNCSIEVTDRTYVEFDVNPTYSSIDGGAGSNNDMYPAVVELDLTTASNDSLTLELCYNYRGGTGFNSNNYKRVVFPDCQQGIWKRQEKFLIQDYFPSAKSIKKIKIGASGWDYESNFDNFSIYNVWYFDIDERANKEIQFNLKNYPNPFSVSTTISYNLPAKMLVDLLIFDVMGNLVWKEVNQTQNSGNHLISINGLTLNSGVYYYQLKAGKYLETKKMIVIK